MYTIVHALILLLSFVGFAIAFHIFEKKRVKKPLICPFRSNCDTVVTSNYSQIFGIPLERMGMAYYALVAVLHVVAFLGDIHTPVFRLLLLVISGGAFFFSLYLISIQAFVLKQWCVWCLSSALISTIIFVLTMVGFSHDVGLLFVPYIKLLTIAHLLGASIGVGGATVTDILFFKFLKDYRISESEAEVMKTISSAIWIGLALIVISGIFLFAIKPDMLLATPKFVVKMIGVLVIIVNGYFLNVVVQPRLIQMRFTNTDEVVPHTGARFRRTAFALGAISITSWYVIFILGALRGLMINFWLLLSMYVVLIALAIAGSQMYVRYLEKKAEGK